MLDAYGWFFRQGDESMKVYPLLPHLSSIKNKFESLSEGTQFK